MTARPLDREDISWHNITVLAMELSKENVDCTQIKEIPKTKQAEEPQFKVHMLLCTEWEGALSELLL